MDIIYKCPYCKSPSTTWFGYDRSVSKGEVHRRKCNVCARVFIPNPDGSSIARPVGRPRNPRVVIPRPEQLGLVKRKN